MITPKETKCAHDPYWTGIYGSCMACKADSAIELKKINAELVRVVDNLLRVCSPSDENGYEIREARAIIEKASGESK